MKRENEREEQMTTNLNPNIFLPRAPLKNVGDTTRIETSLWKLEFDYWMVLLKKRSATYFF
jgi:hypothetical protein